MPKTHWTLPSIFYILLGNSQDMVPVYSSFLRNMNLVVFGWLLVFGSHLYLLSLPWWGTGKTVLFINIAILVVGSILHVRPGSLKEWGRPTNLVQNLFSMGYLVHMVITLLSLYDLHYMAV